MKYFAIFILLVSNQAFSQLPDTVEIREIEFLDSVYADFEPFCETHRLLNKYTDPWDSTFTYFLKDRNSVNDSISCDLLYHLIKEMNFISYDSVYMTSVSNFGVSAINHIIDHGGPIKQIPLGVVDYKFNWFNKDSAITSGAIQLNGISYEIVDPNVPFYEDRISYAGPLFDFISDPEIEFVLTNDFIITEDESAVIGYEINDGSGWTKYKLNEAFTYFCSADTMQFFRIRVSFESGFTIENSVVFQTPKIPDTPQQKWSLGCSRSGKVPATAQNGDKWLEWCLLEGCNNNGIDKPYIIVTGYRPPIFGQSFTRTFELYNTNHAGLIGHLQNNGYDVFIVRFNFHWRPYVMGVEDAANIFIEFLNIVNAAKANESDGYYENIIHGNSMGCDVVTTALLKMEKEHKIDQSSTRFHHSRLFISYDANYFGANIPLSMQYIVKSQFAHYSANTLLTAFLGGWIPVASQLGAIGSIALRIYMNQVVEAKLFKELVSYHTDVNQFNFPWSPWVNRYMTPGEHPDRIAMENVKQTYNYTNSFVPIPGDTRNIGISLGRIKNTLEYPPTSQALGDGVDDISNQFRGPGNTFAYYNGFTEGIEAYALKYSQYHLPIFKRRSFYAWTGIPFMFLHQRMHGNYTREVDNASGSYMIGLGNIGAVIGWVGVGGGIASLDPVDIISYASILGTKYSHKSVLTGLAINPNIWPANGSMSMDIHSLDLLYQNSSNLSNGVKSRHFGYPNLGRPNDHFDITPFEAIYVDEEIDPHIDLEFQVDEYKDSLNQFILNESEPWYLGLQNQNIGSAVLSNYTYRAKRRAKHQIVCGHLVTPSTDPGDYNVLGNGDVVLNAGDEIVLKPGVHISNGAQFHAKIHYDICGSQLPPNINIDGYWEEKPSFPEQFEIETETKSELNLETSIYPNPSKDELLIKSTEEITSIEIFDISGKKIETVKAFGKVFRYSHRLKPGTYFVKIYLGHQVEIHKLLVL